MQPPPPPPPPPPQISDYEQTFKKGTIVEVSSQDEGLRGSWYTATVLRTISRKTHKILVQYHNLVVSDDAASNPLRELVDAILVRPIPPREPHRIFSLMDDVDAFHNDGWWEGVVTKVVRTQLHADDDVQNNNNNNNGVYSVFFRCSREQIDFGSSDLRLHREWLRGNLWVPPLESHYYSPSSGQRKRSGENGRNGSQDRAMRENGGGRDVRRRSSNTPKKQDGIVTNGQERRSSNHSANDVDDFIVRKGKDGKLMISSNGVCKNGLATNGKVKEPTRKASNHTGIIVCGLKSNMVHFQKSDG